MRDIVANSTSSSQEWQRDDNPFSSTGKQVRGIQNQVTEVKLDHYNLQVSDNRYIQKVFANVGQKLNRSDGEIFMSTTMKAAIHFGENYNDNLIVYRNTNFDAFKTLIDITQKLILNQNHEILNVSMIK